MTTHQTTPFQKALEAVESLPLDSRKEVIEILMRGLAAYSAQTDHSFRRIVTTRSGGL